MAITFIESQQAAFPDLAGAYGGLGELFSRKLWHQLTDAVLAFVRDEHNSRGSNFLDLWERFVLQFAARVDQVNLVLIAVLVTQQLTPSRPFVETEVSRAVALLSALGEKKAQLGPGPAAMVALEIASLRLKLGDVDAPKRALGDVKPTIDDLEGEGAEAIIAGTYFRVAAEYHKVVGPPTAFFDNALQFLSHVAWDSLPRASAEALAVDIALAALVGDKIFDFGALVSHPILALLDGSTGAADSAAAASASSSSSAAGGGGGGGGGRRGGAAAADDDGAEEEGAVDVLAMASHGTYGWLKALIFVFQRGDIDGFNALFATHAAAIRAHAVLAAATDVLKEKVTLLGLVELLARRPSSERTVRFDEIVAATHLELGQVEWLLMRGMSLGLLEGSIDEVEQVVRITSVKPRILTPEQTKALRTQVVAWKTNVHRSLISVETLTRELLA